MHLYIMAATYSDADSAAWWLGLQRKQWSYVENSRTLRGTRKPHVLKFGAYWQHRDAKEIDAVIESLNGSTWRAG